jgi:hypothetical protein
MSATVRVLGFAEHAAPAVTEGETSVLDPSGTHAADCTGRLRWENGSILNPGLKRLICRKCGGAGNWFPR